MGQIPNKEISDDPANRHITAKAYEVADDSADELPPIDTTSSFDPTVDDPTEETLSTYVESATPTSMPTEEVLTFESLLNLNPIQATEAMVKRVGAYNHLVLEAAQHAISAKAQGQTLGEIEYGVTEICLGMNKTIEHELTLFPYLLQVLNSREVDKAVEAAKANAVKGMH